MVVFLLEGQNVATEYLVRVQVGQEFQASLVVSVDINVEKLSLQAVVSDGIMNAIDVFTL